MKKTASMKSKKTQALKNATEIPVKPVTAYDNRADDKEEFFNLWVLISQTKDALSKARHRELERFNINPERRAVLWSIQNNGGQSTPVEIAHQLFRELHSVTEMLKRMQEEGLVTRSKSSGKSRVIVKITRKGRQIFNQSLHNVIDQKVFSVLTKKQRERLAYNLRKIRNQALHELGIPEWRIKYPLDPNNKTQ